MKIEYTCGYCGSNYSAYSKSRKFCSRACSILSHRTLPIYKNCEICNDPFDIRYCPKKRCCSYKCSSVLTRNENNLAKILNPVYNTCLNCNVEYLKTKDKPTYCCRKCCNEYRRNRTKPRYTRTCAKCGNKFEVLWENDPKQYCNHSCANSVTTTARFPKTGSFKSCLYCSCEFYVQPSKIDYKFCSAVCGNKFRRNRPVPATRTGEIKKCLVCDTEFYVQKHRLHNAKFCNLKCSTAYYDANEIGWCRFNPDACTIIDEYGAANGYNFQHALNGGEYNVPNTPYRVDGYDFEQNVVIEIDESHHFVSGNLKPADVERQYIIIKELNCKFIRIRI